MFWALVNSQDTLSFGSFPSLLIVNLLLGIILLWPLELTTVQKLQIEGVLRAGGEGGQLPPPCTATRSILSLGVTVLGQISKENAEMNSQGG